MDNKQNIGKAFKEKLDNLKASPQDLIWDNIAKKLDKKEKKRRIIPFWLKYASIAAIILILSGIIWNYSKKENTNKNIEPSNNQTIVKINDTNKLSKIKEKTNYNNIKNKISNKKEVVRSLKTNTSNSTFTPLNNISYKKDIDPYNNILSKKRNIQNLAINKKQLNSKVNNSNIHQNSKLNSIQIFWNEISNRPIVKVIYTNFILNNENHLTFTFAKLPETSNKIDITKEKKGYSKKKKNWSISIKGSPIYYSSIGNKSSIDKSLENNEKTNKLTTSYGLQTSLLITNKISLRTGINKVSLAYNTKNVLPENVISSQISLSNNAFSNHSDVLGIYKDESCYLFFEESFKLTQNINYLEIPLEVSYKLMNKKIKVKIITGFSTLLLQNSNILINDHTLLGTIDNLKKISFTGNLGLGINYRITKYIDLSIEPLVKLQFKTYSDNTNNKPYYFGVSSGFTYKF